MICNARSIWCNVALTQCQVICARPQQMLNHTPKVRRCSPRQARKPHLARINLLEVMTKLTESKNYCRIGRMQLRRLKELLLHSQISKQAQSRTYDKQKVQLPCRTGKTSSNNRRRQRPRRQKLQELMRENSKRISIRWLRSNNSEAWCRHWKRLKLSFQSATAPIVSGSESSSSLYPANIAIAHTAVKTWLKSRRSRRA